jgi:hypothetical protein
MVRAFLKKNTDLENNIVNFFKTNGSTKGIKLIRQAISKIDNKVPLYDIFNQNLFLINKQNVYSRVIRHHYRFPDRELLKMLMNKKKELSLVVDMKLAAKRSSELRNSDESYDKILIASKYKKLGLMLQFTDNFDLDILLDTYIKVFYFFANEVGKNITICIKPSFKKHFSHLDPFYSRSELINLALNMGLIKSDNVFYNINKLTKLCNSVKQNDISAKIIEDHQTHIIKNNKIGIIQYYSLQGSYLMNQYLRGSVDYVSKNIALESMIDSMWKIINTAPAFDKDYILYRFIQKDSHLNHLNIGDTFVTPSFTSTTRDPFYQSDNYKFGFILIKIKIPKNIKGVALCMETISLFPKEEEIILSPRTILKLISKDSNVEYYHPDFDYEVKVSTKYEFEYVGKKDVAYPDRSIRNTTDEHIDFLQLKKPSFISMEEKARTFSLKYVNEQSQFTTNIGQNKYTIFAEWYNSTSVYKKFYGNTAENGFMLYNLTDDHISFTIELGDDDNGTFMYVNYYLKFSVSLNDKEYSEEDFIKFLCTIGNYFSVGNIVIYADYDSCDLFQSRQNKYYGGNYCKDIYQYIKFKKRRFEHLDSTELKPKFNYFLLDKLKKINPSKILTKKDTDEILTIYKKIFLVNVSEDEINISSFYLWLVENYCYLCPLLIKKMRRIYRQNNPFENDYYILDPNIYLYNRGLINEYNIEDSQDLNSITSGVKNSYRLDLQRKTRVPTNRTI